MEVIDTVAADEIEIGDLISVDGEEIEVKEFLDSDDISAVVFRGFSRESGDTETYELPYDYLVDILSY